MANKKGHLLINKWAANPTGHFHCNESHVNDLSDCSRTSGIFFVNA